jgi:ABC-type nickel/cobalt efflux system permease component RcnA
MMQGVIILLAMMQGVALKMAVGLFLALTAADQAHKQRQWNRMQKTT